MAVTISVTALLAALRLGSSDEETAEATRLLAYASAAVTKHVPDCPDVIHNEAVVRLAGYLFEQPFAARGSAFANSLRNSGASAILLPYKVIRAGSVTGAVAAAQQVVGSDTNPVTNVSLQGDSLVIDFADGTGIRIDLPGGVDLSGVAEWALSGNDDPIPGTKLVNAPVPVIPDPVDVPTDAEIDERADDRITALVKAFARDAGSLIVPEDLFGVNHPNNRQVAVSTEGNFQLIAGGGDGGGEGDPVEVTRVDLQFMRSVLLARISAQAITQTTWATIDDEDDDPVVCPSSGQLEILAYAKSGDRDNSIAYAKVPAAELRLTPTNGELQLALGANRWFGVRVNNGTDHHLQLKGQTGQNSTNGNYFVDIRHIQNHTVEVVTDVTGSVVGGEGGEVDLALIEPFAIRGNTAEIPTTRFPFSIPAWLSELATDIPWTKLDGTLAAWVRRTNTDVIPDTKLPAARLLPSPAGIADGQIAKVQSGAWAIGTDEAGAGASGAKVWRFELISGSGAQSEDVFVRLKFIDTFSDTGVRTNAQDLGTGYLTAAGTRTISQNAALDIKTLLGITSLAALMNRVTALPTAGDATWGEFYGLSDTAGRVKDVFYRREVEVSILDWRVERLSSTNRDLHGYAQVARGGANGYSAGGSLFPGRENIEELIEEKNENGNVTVRCVVNDGGLLLSNISVILFYDNGDGEYSFSTARELPLFHDASFTIAGQRRYVSAVANVFRFVPGRRYGLKFRNAGQAHDLILSAGNHMVALADADDLEAVKSEALREIYALEDRLAAAESGGGGLTLVAERTGVGISNWSIRRGAVNDLVAGQALEVGDLVLVVITTVDANGVALFNPRSFCEPFVVGTTAQADVVITDLEGEAGSYSIDTSDANWINIGTTFAALPTHRARTRVYKYGIS